MEVELLFCVCFAPVGPTLDLKKKKIFAGFRTTLFLMAVTVFLNSVSFIPYKNDIFPSGVPI